MCCHAGVMFWILEEHRQIPIFPRGISKGSELQALLLYECDAQNQTGVFYINLKQIYVQDNKPDGWWERKANFPLKK